jgi:hypothetical protein
MEWFAAQVTGKVLQFDQQMAAAETTTQPHVL